MKYLLIVPIDSDVDEVEVVKTSSLESGSKGFLIKKDLEIHTNVNWKPSIINNLEPPTSEEKQKEINRVVMNMWFKGEKTQ